MHLLDELGQRPEVDRCVECDRVLEAEERFRWVPPLGGILCERCPGPPHDRAGISLEALKLLKAYQRLDIEAIADAPPGARRRARDRGRPARVRPRPRSSATRARSRSSTRSATRRRRADGDRRAPRHRPPSRSPRVPAVTRNVARAARGRCSPRVGGGRHRDSARGSAVGRLSGGPRRACARPAARRRTAPRTAHARSTRRCGWPTSTPIRCCGAATCSRARPRPGRRPAARRGQRRAPGPRRHHEVAAPPQHRAQRRPQRRRRAARARARLAAGDLAAAAAAGAPPGGPGRRAGGPLGWRVPGHPLERRTSPTYEAARRDRPAITAGLLAIEGAHALDGDPANVEVVADAGFRMMSPSHFFDNAFGGSAHGIDKGGLTDGRTRDGPPDGGARDAGRRRPRLGGDDRRHPGDGRAAGRRLAHRACAGSPTTLATCPTRTLRGIAGDRRRRRHRLLADGLRRRRRRRRSRARSATRSTSPAIEHVGLGSDFDGAVPVPVRCDRARPAHRRAARRRPRRRRRSRRSWAATPGGCWPTSCPTGRRLGRRVRSAAR